MGSKHWIGAAMAAGLACNLAWAQEQVRARVISAVPVMQQVAVPQQLCDNEEVYTGQRVTGTGAVVGAVIGGLAGNALGHGSRHGPHGYYQPSTRGPSTVVGAVAGGLIGNSIESANSQPNYETVRRCTNTTRYENHTVGYDVSYEYAGQRYHTQLDYDPGPWLDVTVQPKGSYSSSSASTGISYTGPGGVYQSAPAGVTVTTNSIEYMPPPVPIVIGVNAGGYAPPPPGYRPPPPPPGYFPPPAYGQRPPPPPGWRPPPPSGPHSPPHWR